VKFRIRPILGHSTVAYQSTLFLGYHLLLPFKYTVIMIVFRKQSAGTMVSYKVWNWHESFRSSLLASHQR